MLVAVNSQGHLVNLLEQEGSRTETYTCPACTQPVQLKQGKIMRAHFAHVRLKGCHFFHENESEEHLTLKSLLYRSLVATGHQVQIEAVLPEIGQVADLLVNDKLILEVQCSRLSLSRLEERTKLYQQAGYKVIWLLGRKLWLGKHLSSLHQGLVYFSQNMGFHLWELDLEHQQLHLRYLLHKNLEGQVVGLSKTYSLRGDLLVILRQPFISQPLARLEVSQHPEPLAYIQRQLCYKNGKWLSRQAEAYARGDNLLAKAAVDFYPQVLPLKGHFCQISTDLTPYYQAFDQFYAQQLDKTRQILYSPRFYDIIALSS